MFDEQGVRRLLRERCSQLSQKEFAEKYDISPQYINDVLSGRRMPGMLILDALGLSRRIVYEFTCSDSRKYKVHP